MRLLLEPGQQCIIAVDGHPQHATVVRDTGRHVVLTNQRGLTAVRHYGLVFAIPEKRQRPTSVWQNMDYSVREHGWPLTEAE